MRKRITKLLQKFLTLFTIVETDYKNEGYKPISYSIDGVLQQGRVLEYPCEGETGFYKIVDSKGKNILVDKKFVVHNS